MFINYSNHPQKKWLEAQLKEAHKYGEIYDVSFPDVLVTYTKEDIERLANKELERIKQVAEENGTDLNHTIVMAQGEFSLTFALITKIKNQYPDCKVVCAISKREVVEEKKEDCNVKVVQFRFCGFREY